MLPALLHQQLNFFMNHTKDSTRHWKGEYHKYLATFMCTSGNSKLYTAVEATQSSIHRHVENFFIQNKYTRSQLMLCDIIIQELQES